MMKKRTELISFIDSIVTESISAWHGTSHKFDKFSSDRINSGIGSQAFGWGLYFSSLKDVALGYAESLEDVSQVTIDNVVPSPAVTKLASRIISLHGKTQKLVLHILKLHVGELLEKKEITKKEYDFIQNAKKIKIERGRYVYQVDLHKDKTPDQYDYLKWDRPVSDSQIRKIQNQIQKENYSGRVSVENGKLYKDWGTKSEILTGGDLYRAFAGDKGFSPKEASLFLLRAGIDGIVHWGEYVVFDPESIVISKRSSF